MFLSSYRNTGLNQSACVFALGYFLTIKGYISAKDADHRQYARLPRDPEVKPALSRTSPYTEKETKTVRIRTVKRNVLNNW